MQVSFAQEPGEDSSVGVTQAESFEQALVAAKLKYFQGDIPGATEGFEHLRLRVSAGEKPPISQFGEVLVYLGEIYYLDGQSETAESIFRELLMLDPQYPISPYEHPMEVVGIFEMLRRSTLRPTPEIPQPVKRLPVWGYAPFGVSQFRQNRKKAGVLYASAQITLGITSIATYLHLRQINEVNPPPALAEEELQRRVRTERYLVQWPATIGFYALWGASVIEGRQTWGDGQAAMLNRPVGAQVAFSHHF